jgi:hypothetical protein
MHSGGRLKVYPTLPYPAVAHPLHSTSISAAEPLHRGFVSYFISKRGNTRLVVKQVAYLFSVLQHVLKDQPSSTHLRLSPLVKQALSDWSDLASNLSEHPVPIASLVPRPPHYVGAT